MRTLAADRKRRLYVLQQQRRSPAVSDHEWDLETIAETAETVMPIPALNEFASACGSRGPLTLRVREAGHDWDGETHVLKPPVVLIGRSGHCDLCLPHPEISFRHAYLQVIGGGLLCVDLESRTGIHTSSGRVQAGWISPGESMTVGPYELMVGEIGVGPEEPLSAAEQAFAEVDLDGEFPQFALEFLNSHTDAGCPRLWPVRRRITLIGRTSHCKMRLQDETVSKIHGSLVLTPTGLWIVDLLGRRGITVDGQLVRCARLNDGQELSIGRFRIGVRAGFHAGASEGKDSFLRPSSSATIVVPTESAETPAAPAQPTDLQRQEPAGPESNPGTELAEPIAAPPAGIPQMPASSVGFSESFVLALVNQFATMQQQMFAQTQQQMLLLTQMFSSMHKCQLDVIRDELARVNAISLEMQQLQAELLRAQMRGAFQPAPATNIGLQITPTTILAMPAATSGLLVTDGASCSVVEASTAVTPSAIEHAPDAARVPDASAETAAPPDPPLAGRTNPPKPADAAPKSQAASADSPGQANAGPVGEPASKSSGGASEPSESESEVWRNQQAVENHAWLVERMAHLERERTSRWNRILSALTGAGHQERV